MSASLAALEFSSQNCSRNTHTYGSPPIAPTLQYLSTYIMGSRSAPSPIFGAAQMLSRQGLKNVPRTFFLTARSTPTAPPVKGKTHAYAWAFPFIGGDGLPPFVDTSNPVRPITSVTRFIVYNECNIKI